MFDVVITRGIVVDGSGKPGYPADVGILGGKIEAIEDLSQAETARVIDASGLTVSPGFIDSHTHSDASLLTNPQHAQGLRQGITTEILGQDGLSYAPLSADNYETYRRYLAGILGRAPAGLDMSGVAAFRSHYHNKTAINTAYLVAHGAIRLETCGFQDVPMTGDRMKHALRLVEEGLEQGAVGLATGLSYHPHSWSTTEEIVELCGPVQKACGVYVTHLRDVHPERGFGGGGVPEALEVGRRSGVKVHFSHTRTAAGNAGQVAELMEPIDAAKAEGLDITLELYPYPTGSTFAVSNLPSWASAGGPEEILDRLTDSGDRARIVEHLESMGKRSIAESVLSHLPRHPQYEGMSVADIADDLGMGLGETMCHMLVEEDLEVGFWLTPPDSVNTWRQTSRDAIELLSRPDYMVGSDSIQAGGSPHPRAYGTFPRFLGRLRRRYAKITLEQMVQRVTDNPARRFGLTGRGRVEKGYFADLVVFDPDRIIDTATYDEPRHYPAGIPYVLVNGKVAVDGERCTGVLAGQAIP